MEQHAGASSAVSAGLSPVNALSEKVKGLVVSARRRRIRGRRRRDSAPAQQPPARVVRYRVMVEESESADEEDGSGVTLAEAAASQERHLVASRGNALRHDVSSGALMSLVSLEGSADAAQDDEFDDVWETFVDTHAPTVAEQMRSDAALARSLQDIEDTNAFTDDDRHDDPDSPGHQQPPSVVTRAAIMTADGRRVTIPHISTRADSIQPTTAAIAQAIRRGMQEQAASVDDGFVVVSRPSVFEDDELGGATMDEVATLPVRPYEPCTRENEASDTNCSICLMQCDAGENVMTLPCMHIFHAKCVTDWLVLKRSCPVCKHVACGT